MISLLSDCQTSFILFHCVPFLGLAAAFRPVGKVGVTWAVIRLQFNMYTAPAFLGALLALVNIAFLMAWFKECKVDQTNCIQEGSNRTIQDTSDEILLSKEDEGKSSCGLRCWCTSQKSSSEGKVTLAPQRSVCLSRVFNNAV